MTFELEGCDCCCKGLSPKPCLCCFACGDGCRQVGTLHAGDLTGRPGEANGKRERTKLIGETIQPVGGGGFKPIMQLMDRADPNETTGRSELFAATRGPCLSGGCSKLCCDAEFGQAVASDQDSGNVSKMHKLNFGDFATIFTKLKPKTMAQGAREMFTDSDLFDIQFKNPSMTPQQKANVLAQMVHLSRSVKAVGRKSILPMRTRSGKNCSPDEISFWTHSFVQMNLVVRQLLS